MLTDLLRQRVRADGDTAFLCTESTTLSYRAFLVRVSALAEQLRRFSGMSVGYVADDALDSITFLFAACDVGAEACLYPAQISSEEALDFAERFGHVQISLESDGGVVIVCEGDSAVGGMKDDVENERSLAVLTSGTTGTPKATRHRFRSLIASASQGRGPTSSAGTTWLLVYNVNQYAGLQLLAHVLNTGGTLVIPPENRPAAALDSMIHYGVTHVSATPTFWRMLLALLSRGQLRPPELRQITIGGEAVSESLLQQLASCFPTARISHIYATTEIGSAIAVSDGRAGLPEEVLDRKVGNCVQLRISEGELHARSRVGMFGYHGSEVVADDWISTGDLVELRDGRIHFVGRVGNVINVGGIKVPPLPIEEIIGNVAGVELVRVFGRSNPITGNIVAADVVAQPGCDLLDLRRDIALACEVLPEAHRPRIVKMVDSLSVVQMKLDRRKE
ncbi:AMP-binding enzyme family protein [Rhodococcus sp. MTM3W5.2]|nr:class I adenylate-forming enzyme family protein [Rhodococcus sp. MTM3W5.2]AQA23341.1 AMP-binding enzyme family protein [Rhodococcus sp. MTM3W5.2]